jgi:predicted TIM-barrel fold metal-dependent hydrolase
MFIVDADIHVNDTPGNLAPYISEPWRHSLEALAQGKWGYLDIPGFAPSLKLDPPMVGQHDMRSVHTPEQMRTELDAIGIDIGILFPDNMLLMAPIPLAEYAVALSRAYNTWIADQWIGKAEGLYAAVLACPQDPHAAADQIREFGSDRRVAAIYLPTAGVNPMWGNRKYDPIFEAAVELDLPVVLHSVTIVSPAFPCNTDQFENAWARQMMGHSFAMMGNFVSMLHTGLPARFPELRIVFTEAGIGWVPYMTWRADKYHREFRRQVPFLELPPSEYVKRQMWFATQPIEEPENPAFMVETIHHVGDDRVIFASDWPHHDFDHPKGVLNLPMSQDLKRKVMGENALDAFKRISRPGLIDG